MNAMLVRSPGPRSTSASASVVLDAGTLSPVSADSSMSSECASMILPSAATLSPASSMTTSPGTTSSAGISASAPSRRTRAVCFISDLSAFIALSALPSWRRPVTALNTVSAMSTRPVLHWPMTSEIDGGDQQDDLHVGAVLVEEPPPARLALLLGKSVGTVLLQELRGLRRRRGRSPGPRRTCRRRPRPRARTSARPSPPSRRLACQSLPSLLPHRRRRRVTSTSCPSCCPSSCPSCRPCRRPSRPPRAPRPRTGRPRRRREPRPPAAPWSP